MVKISTQIKEKVWMDEMGQPIPVARIQPLEKQKERVAFSCAKEAMDINNRLSNFKEKIGKECRVIYAESMKDAKPGKGNFTFFNFDGSIKLEVQVNELITFDSVLIEKAKQKLMEMVGEGIRPELEFLKELVMGAFQTSRGMLDTKRVMGLKKHAKRIKDERYHEAMAFIDASVRRPSSKTYFRVWLRGEQGEYKIIDLNFSSI